MNERAGFVAAQFRNPHGLWGQIAGRIMLVTNRKVNRFVVETMNVKPDDRVLEIGFGPGGCITMLAQRATNGTVSGIDPSATMNALAATRNRELIRSGRVELKSASVSAIPYSDETFDKICSINNVYFWPSLVDDLREVRRTMKSDGLFALAFRKEPYSDAPIEPPSFDPDKMRSLLREAGYRESHLETCKIPPWTAACVLARK